MRIVALDTRGQITPKIDNRRLRRQILNIPYIRLRRQDRTRAAVSRNQIQKARGSRRQQSVGRTIGRYSISSSSISSSSSSSSSSISTKKMLEYSLSRSEVQSVSRYIASSNTRQVAEALQPKSLDTIDYIDRLVLLYIV